MIYFNIEEHSIQIATVRCMLKDISKTMEILIGFQFLQNPNVCNRNRIITFNLVHVGSVVVV